MVMAMVVVVVGQGREGWRVGGASGSDSRER